MFPSRSGKPVSATTLPKMLQYHRIAAVAQGFRSNFRLGHGDLSGPGGVTIVPTATALDERPGAKRSP